MDDLCEGGYLEGSSILVSGGTGCGKTIFALQYLYNGAKQQGDPSLFITLEEGPTNLWWNMQRFRWDIADLERQNLLKIYKMGLGGPKDFEARFEQELERITDVVTEMGVKRLAIDSLTALSLWLATPGEIRAKTFEITEALKKLKCTTLLTCETAGGKKDFSRYGVEEFVVDGVIALYFMPPNRGLFIRKMRGTDHSKAVHPLEIGTGGMSTNPQEEILWEAIKD